MLAVIGFVAGYAATRLGTRHPLVSLRVGHLAETGRVDRCLNQVIHPIAVVSNGTIERVMSHCTGLEGDSRSRGLFSAPVIAAQLHCK